MTCTFCHQTGENLPVHTRLRYKDRVYTYYSCTGCATKRLKRYRYTEKGKEVVKRAVVKYERSHPLRKRAWNIAKSIPLGRCEKCGGNRNIHRHHPDVSEADIVVFLCAKHHKEAHRVTSHVLQ